MKKSSEIQEWVEVSAAGHADVAARFSREHARRIAIEMTGNLLTRPDFEEFTEKEQEILTAALMWKTTEKLAQYFAEQCEGWCETYYRDLKRLYEEEQ